VPINDDLEKIAALQGRVVPRGDFIAGFGSGDPPAPSDVPSARETYGPPIEPPSNSDPEPEAFDDPGEGGTLPPSSLIPESANILPVAVRRAPVGKFSVETPDLTILGSDAAFQEHRVKLLDSEVGQIKVVVLRAIQRVMRARLVEVEKVLPKRKRRGVSVRASSQRASAAADRLSTADGYAAGASSGESGPIPPTPKKRGRPRKVKP
jgi:hypothetical protein